MLLVTADDVIAGFNSLNPEGKEHVRETILMSEKPQFDLKAWLLEWDRISAMNANEQGTDKSITSLDLLRAVRGEE